MTLWIHTSANRPAIMLFVSCEMIVERIIASFVVVLFRQLPVYFGREHTLIDTLNNERDVFGYAVFTWSVTVDIGAT